MDTVQTYDGLVRTVDGLVCLGCGCSPRWRVTFGNMLPGPTNSASFVFQCSPADPWSRVFCSDKVGGSPTTNRWMFSNRDFSAINGTFDLALTVPKPTTVPFGVVLREFAYYTRFLPGTFISCGGGSGNEIDSRTDTNFLRFSLSATGVSSGPGIVVFNAILHEMTAAYPSDTVFNSRPIGKWTKSVSLASGQYWHQLGSVDLDIDLTSGGTGVPSNPNHFANDRGSADIDSPAPVGGGANSCYDGQVSHTVTNYATCRIDF